MRLKAAKLLLVGGLALLTGGFGAWAQDAKKADGPKKRTDIDFEDELVEGELKKPELFYLLQKKQFNFKRLIKLREDFLPEMRRDADEIRRGRSKN
ncbi:MAG TPA: hypothetical protein PKC28_02685 [Bdellovibrionales bacterium]|nr:hypothetical protein [Bdellovibrionales bacterium]